MFHISLFLLSSISSALHPSILLPSLLSSVPSNPTSPTLYLVLSVALSMGSGCSAGGAGGWCDGSAVWCRRWSGWTSRRRGRSELSASASPRVTFHGQLVSEQRRARRLSAPLIVKISGNQCAQRCALSPLLVSHVCLRPSLSLPPSLFVAALSASFPLMCFCSSLANGWHLAICYLTVQVLLSLEMNSRNTLKRLSFSFPHALFHFRLSLMLPAVKYLLPTVKDGSKMTPQKHFTVITFCPVTIFKVISSMLMRPERISSWQFIISIQHIQYI